MQKDNKNYLLYISLFIVSPMFAVLGVVKPVFAPVVSLISGSFMGVALTFIPLGWIVLPIAAVFFLALQITGSYYWASFAVILFAPASLGFAFSFKRKIKLNATIAISTIAFCVSLAFLGSIFLYLREGMLNMEGLLKVVAPINEKINMYFQLLIDYAQRMPYQSAEEKKVITEALASYRNIFSDSILPILPGYIAAYSLMQNFLSFLLAKTILKGIDYDLSYLEKFDEIRISKPGAIIYILAYIGSMLFLGIAGLAMENFVLIMSLAFGCAGVSVSYYLLAGKRTRVIKGLVLTALIILFFIPVGCIMFFSITGLFDSFINYRRFPDNKPKSEDI